MSLADPARSTLLVIDLQTRLVPAVAGGAEVVANARRLLAAAALLGVPAVFTEQNPRGLGPTVPDLAPPPTARLAVKMSFDAWRAGPVRDAVLPDTEVIVAGCEAHVCVLQTVLAALADGRRVKVVADAVGSRRTENRDAALARMARHGADVVTTEMVIFEWLGTAEHPRFRDVMALVKSPGDNPGTAIACERITFTPCC